MPGTADPIRVGANSEVGSGAELKDKVKEALGGVVGGVVGNIFGGGRIGTGGGSSSGGTDPKLAKDPIPDDNKKVFTDPNTGIKISVGMTPTADGLQVSTAIVDSPDDGTFQTIYLQDPEGRKAGPTRYDIYELYQDWELTVSWTYDRWVNGEHVEHDEGGWSEEGRDILGTFAIPQENDGLWNRLGFSTATKGVRSLGAFFPISNELLQSEPMKLVIHVTRPGEEPVTTVPFVISVPPC